MAFDVWLLRRTLITCLLLSVFAGIAKGANETLSTYEVSLPDTKDHASDGFPSGATNNLIRNGSSKAMHNAEQRIKNSSPNKSKAPREHMQPKSKQFSDTHGKHATKRTEVERSEETGANRTRMQELEKYFVNPETVKRTPAEENGFTKESFLSAISLDGLNSRQPDAEMALQNEESELRTTQNLDQDVSAHFLDWSRKGLGNEEPTEDEVKLDGNFEKYGESSLEGRKIVNAASLLESSLESQSTGLTESVKYPGEKVGNRARAFQYFLPTQSTMKFKQRSRYRYVNSLIKPQLAGISADLIGLESQRNPVKSVNLKTLKNDYKSHELVESAKQSNKAQVGENVSERNFPTDPQAKDGNKDSTEQNDEPQYNANDMFMLGTPDHSTFLEDVFLAHPHPTHLFSGLGDEKYVPHGKYKARAMARPTLPRQMSAAKEATANQSKISKVAFGKLQESGFQEEFIHSGEELDSNESNVDLNSKLNGGLPLISQTTKKLREKPPGSLQLLKDKAMSHIEEESNDLYNQRNEDFIGSGGSAQAHRVRPSPYFRPTKTRGFSKVATLPSYKRTTIPGGTLSSEYKPWDSGSGETSGGGDGIPAREHYQKQKPTQRPTIVETLSKTRNAHAGIFGVTDRETKKKCEKMGKSDFREKCPHGWLSFEEFCYLFVPHSKGKWEEFPLKCNKETALLAMPKTDKEIKFLQDKISSLKHRTKYFYIGLRKKSGVWTWIDDVPFTSDVHVKDTLGTKKCGALSKGGEIQMVTCKEPKAGYVCELKTGVKALSILALGDSLTNGFHSDDKSHTPYAKTLEYLLNKDVHRCYTLTMVAKDGTEASEMSSQLQSHLQNAKTKYSWVVILAGTNDILHNSHTRNRKAWDTAVEHIIDLHITSHRFGAKTMAVTIPEMDCEESDRPPCQHTRLERNYINEKLRHYARTNDFTILCDLATKFPRYSLSDEERKKMWEEGLHMTHAGYEKMAEIIYEDLLAHVDE